MQIAQPPTDLQQPKDQPLPTEQRLQQPKNQHEQLPTAQQLRKQQRGLLQTRQQPLPHVQHQQPRRHQHLQQHDRQSRQRPTEEPEEEVPIHSLDIIMLLDI